MTRWVVLAVLFGAAMRCAWWAMRLDGPLKVAAVLSYWLLTVAMAIVIWEG